MHPQRVLFDAQNAPKEASWNLLLPVGDKYRWDFGEEGRISLNEGVLSLMAMNFKAEQGHDRAINYNHAMFSTSPEDGVAAGWIEDVDVRPDGLYVKTKWTDRAKEYIRKDEYRYLSAEFSMDATDPNTGKSMGPKLFGAALLNDPFITEQPKVAASEKGKSMLPKSILKALNIPEASTESDAATAIEKLSASVETVTAEAMAKALKLAEIEKLNAELADQVKALSEAKNTLEAEKKVAEVTAYFDNLVREGRCTPALREGLEKIALANGIESVKFLETAAPVVDIKKETGLAGAAAPEDKKKSAYSRFSEKVAELQKGGLTYRQAMDQAKRLLPEDFNLSFS